MCPLTYRDTPVEGHEQALAGEMHHSALGTRWVYDGVDDPCYRVMVAGAALTGQGEALGVVSYDGSWFIAPTHVRITGGGWTQERVSVDGFEPVPGDPQGAHRAVLRNERFQLVIHRKPVVGDRPPLSLAASWPGHPSVVLAEVTELA